MDALPGKLHITMPSVDNKVTENLTQAQAKRLLEVLDAQEDQNLASLVRLALFTGMRRSALLHLRWNDLDFERGFPGRNLDSPRENITGFLKKIRVEAELPETFRPLHGLRHSFASWLANSGQVTLQQHDGELSSLKSAVRTLQAEQATLTEHLTRLNVVYENLQPLLAKLNALLPGK